MTRRVLVVDDDADLRFLLRVALDQAGSSTVVAEAANGRDAIAAAREHQPDVIVLDEAMPVMCGSEAIPGLREAVPGARIVMYSAYAATEIGERLKVAADAVFAKGGSLAELADLVVA